MNKWTAWYDSLPEHTKQYLKTQPLWHDIDLAKSFVVGVLVGFFIGFMI